MKEREAYLRIMVDQQKEHRWGFEWLSTVLHGGNGVYSLTPWSSWAFGTFGQWNIVDVMSSFPGWVTAGNAASLSTHFREGSYGKGQRPWDDHAGIGLGLMVPKEPAFCYPHAGAWHMNEANLCLPVSSSANWVQSGLGGNPKGQLPHPTWPQFLTNRFFGTRCLF